MISEPDNKLNNGTDNHTAVYNDAYTEYNQILLAKKDENALLNVDLKPTEYIDEVVTLSTTNVEDVDLNYYNIVEILELENSAGRVDTYSTPGNLNPVTDYTDYDKYSTGVIEGTRGVFNNRDGVDIEDDGIIDRYSYEPDSSKSEHVLITDPTGDTHYYYVLIGTVLVIFTAGILLIKKFVIPKM